VILKTAIGQMRSYGAGPSMVADQHDMTQLWRNSTMVTVFVDVVGKSTTIDVTMES
jgi:hypothetical protein